LKIWLALPYLVFVHELGHAVAAQLLGLRWRPVMARVHGLPIAPAVGVYLPSGGLPALADLAVATSGPIASLLVAAAAWRFSPHIAVPSAAFGTASLVPIKKQDGWRAWTAARRLLRRA